MKTTQYSTCNDFFKDVHTPIVRKRRLVGPAQMISRVKESREEWSNLHRVMPNCRTCTVNENLSLFLFTKLNMYFDSFG